MTSPEKRTSVVRVYGRRAALSGSKPLGAMRKGYDAARERQQANRP
jgi:hypothetical protein